MKKVLIVFLLGAFVLSISSCSLFRKKNKCMSCPTWKDEVELAEDHQDEPQEEITRAQSTTAE